MEDIKIPFFKRVKRAIANLESYSDFAVEKLNIAIKYYVKLTIIFALIISVVFSYKFSTIINNEEEMQILNNQLIDSGLDLQVIEQAFDYLRENNNTQFYISLALSLTLYIFLSYFILIAFDIFLASILGVIASRITKIRIKYKSIFAMSIYGFTLSIILNCIYNVINILTGFTIDYFQIVYCIIAYIYIVTAILIIKTDFINQQKELIRIVKEQEKVRREKRQEKKDKEEDNDEEKQKNDDEDKPEDEQNPVQTN